MKNINIVLIAIFAALSFTACDKENYSQNNIVGKWYTSDYNSANDTIHFTADMYVRGYFPQYLSLDNFFTYSLSDNSITFTAHHSNEEISETFEYILNGNKLTIKGFSNPFSDTDEAKFNVIFTKKE
ncbi:MAG: hypothetical protein LBT56_08250 [Prevotellaceae bacterium]|jgi:hypothetical protein|nr:hypothetical protein [Prevotellaceae bacterium]